MPYFLVAEQDPLHHPSQVVKFYSNAQIVLAHSSERALEIYKKQMHPEGEIIVRQKFGVILRDTMPEKITYDEARKIVDRVRAEKFEEGLAPLLEHAYKEIRAVAESGRESANISFDVATAGFGIDNAMFDSITETLEREGFTVTPTNRCSMTVSWIN